MACRHAGGRAVTIHFEQQQEKRAVRSVRTLSFTQKHAPEDLFADDVQGVVSMSVARGSVLFLPAAVGHRLGADPDVGSSFRRAHGRSLASG